MRFLKNIFASKEQQFQQKAIDILRHSYRSTDFQRGGDADSIRVMDRPIDICDLRSRCLENEIDSPSIIEQYFSHPVSMTNIAQTISWEEGKSKIRLQLVPAIFLNASNLAHQPLTDGIEICFVFGPDGPFVTTETFASWSVSGEELMLAAIENLSAGDFEMEVTVTDGADRFIGVENDPFSAARILLPHVRNTAIQKLGEPYYAGLPNRSFLILWSAACSQRFHEYAIEKVQNDFSVEPYPLTPKIFQVRGSTIEPCSIS